MAGPNEVSHAMTFLLLDIFTFSRRFDPKRLTIRTFSQKKEKLQYISVGTVRMFIEPRAKH